MRHLKSPFPWFGGKSKVSEIVWDRFGDVPNYCEPFFGSGAVLLNRPHGQGTETINDLDCMVANFWRALQNDPDGVARHADNPVNEADQHARHWWLCSQEEFRERMKTDPYADGAERTSDLYSSDSGDVANDVRRWAIKNGDNPELRIALCGYEGEHEMPESWECIAWKARGGYGSQGNNSARENATRERIWFSPYCLRPMSLFAESL